MARRASISCSCQLMSHFWYPETPFFASETFKIQSPKPQKHLLLGPWNSIFRLWNVQNLVPKTSKSSTFGSLFWTGFWTFHGRNLEFRGPKKSSKWHKSVTIALVSCGHRHTHRQTHAHQNFGSLCNRPFGQKFLSKNTMVKWPKLKDWVISAIPFKYTVVLQ